MTHFKVSHTHASVFTKKWELKDCKAFLRSTWTRARSHALNANFYDQNNLSAHYFAYKTIQSHDSKYAATCNSYILGYQHNIITYWTIMTSFSRHICMFQQHRIWNAFSKFFVVSIKMINLVNQFPFLFFLAVTPLLLVVHFQQKLWTQIMPTRHLFPNKGEIKGINRYNFIYLNIKVASNHSNNSIVKSNVFIIEGFKQMQCLLRHWNAQH